MKSIFFMTLLLAAMAASCVSSWALPAQPAPVPPPPAQVEPVTTPEPPPAPTPDPYDYSAPVPESDPVEDGWFSDAVFIGDSRTDGLRLYSGIQNAAFLCYKGLTVFDVTQDKAVIQADGQKLGVLQALEQSSYSKVYLMLGLNELGYNNNQGFADTYGALVDRLKELEPDASIYLQLVIPVSTEMCRKTDQAYYVTNEQIAVYNDIIQSIAEEKQVYCVSPPDTLLDETGELPADASSDGIHFHREGYQIWYDYLKSHTVKEDIP